MSIYKDSVNQLPSSERYKKYSESLHDSYESFGFGLSGGLTPKEAIRNQRLQQQLLQQQMKQQSMYPPQQMYPPNQMYPWQQPPQYPTQMMPGPIVPQHMGVPKGFIGGNNYNPYTYK